MHVYRDLSAVIGEIDARRRFAAEISEWLKETGNTEAFEQWRAARNTSDTLSVRSA